MKLRKGDYIDTSIHDVEQIHDFLAQASKYGCVGAHPSNNGLKQSDGRYRRFLVWTNGAIVDDLMIGVSEMHAPSMFKRQFVWPPLAWARLGSILAAFSTVLLLLFSGTHGGPVVPFVALTLVLLGFGVWLRAWGPGPRPTRMYKIYRIEGGARRFVGYQRATNENQAVGDWSLRFPDDFLYEAVEDLEQ